MTDEMIEYLWLRPKVTGLAIDVFTDDGGAWKRNGHEPFLLMRNGYGREVTEFVPVTISASPIVQECSFEIKVSEDVINDVKLFIIKNLDLLLAFADSFELGTLEFLDGIKKVK